MATTEQDHLAAVFEFTGAVRRITRVIRFLTFQERIQFAELLRDLADEIEQRQAGDTSEALDLPQWRNWSDDPRH